MSKTPRACGTHDRVVRPFGSCPVAVSGMSQLGKLAIGAAHPCGMRPTGELEITDVDMENFCLGRLEAGFPGRAFARLEAGTADWLREGGSLIAAIRRKRV